MAKYYRQQGETKKRKILRFLRPAVLVLFIGVLAGTGVFIYDIFRQSEAADESSQLSTPVSSSIVANTQIQTTSYFQFQTPEKWRAVANETREGHYVYRQYNGPLVEQELVVDVNNQQPEVLATTHINRVLPVTVSSKGFMDVVGTELAHCKKVVKPGTEKTQQMVVLDKVNLPCNPDYTGYEVVVGLVGGSHIMMLPRPSADPAPYKITYRNVSATPSSRDIISIIKTFETR